MKQYTLLLVLALFMVGCGGGQRIIRYYTIDIYSASDTVDAAVYATLPYTVEVIEFTVSGPYNDNRIVLRTHTNELEYYHFHQWAEMPASMIRYFMWKTVTEAALFERTSHRMTATVPDYILTGVIHELERIDMDEEYAGVRINAVFNLIHVRQDRIVVTHSFNRVTPIAANAPMNQFAREISEILHAETRAFLELIAQQLRDQ